MQKSNFNKRKARVFLLFLLASGLIWFLNTLSHTYLAKATVKLNYHNTNKNLRLTKAFTDKLDLNLETVGFRFLGFNLKKKSIDLDLTKVKQKNNKYYLAPNDYKGQIEKQLPKSMVLQKMVTDTLYFSFLEMTSKEVPVYSEINLHLATNYLLDGDLIIEPATVTLTGPKEEIDSITTIYTEDLGRLEITGDFSKKVKLYKSPNLLNSTYSKAEVQLEGKVSKFSEKIIKTPVVAINLPSGKQIRTFPDEVSIVCKAKIERLKEIKPSDFQVIADYLKLSNNRSNTIQLSIQSQPDNIFSATLIEAKVEYILNKE